MRSRFAFLLFNHCGLSCCFPGLRRMFCSTSGPVLKSNSHAWTVLDRTGLFHGVFELFGSRNIATGGLHRAVNIVFHLRVFRHAFSMSDFVHSAHQNLFGYDADFLTQFLQNLRC